MAADKQTAFDFNPRDKVFRRKLWVHLKSTDGSRVYVFWKRIAGLLIILAVVGWLSLSAATWTFVKYKRGVTEAAFTDIAFYPWRAREYRETLSRHYLETAQAHLQTGLWSKAVFSLRLSIAKNTNQREARRILADIYDQIQRTDLAIQLLEGGMLEAIDDSKYLRRLLTLLRKEKDHRRIIEIGTELLPPSPEKNPAHQEIVYHVAQAHLDLEQGDRAKDILSEWSLDRTLRGQIFLADVDQAQGYPRIAILNLEQLHGKTKNDRIILKLITLYRNTDRLEDARGIALQRVFLSPNSAGARIDLITLLQATDDQVTMEREFYTFLESYSEDLRALTLLTNTVISFPRPDLAIQIREMAPKDESGRPPALFQIAVMQAQCSLGEYKNALKTGKALDDYPRLSKVYLANINLMRAWANYGLGEPLKGDSWLKLSLSEDYASMISDTFLLVNRLRDLGQTEDVRRVLVKLVERSQGNPLPLMTLAQHDLEVSNWSGVLEYLSDLFAMDPEPTKILQTISRDLPEDRPLPTELRAKLDLYY